MAEDTGSEVKTTAGSDASLRTAVIGSSLIMWILAIFMIYALNGIKGELEQINQTTSDLIPIISALNLANFQIVDQNGKVVTKFQQTPAPAVETEGSILPLKGGEGGAN